MLLEEQKLLPNVQCADCGHGTYVFRLSDAWNRPSYVRGRLFVQVPSAR